MKIKNLFFKKFCFQGFFKFCLLEFACKKEERLFIINSAHTLNKLFPKE